MTQWDIKSGVTSSGIVLGANDVLNVSSGGVVSSASNVSPNTANVVILSGGRIVDLNMQGGGVVYNSGVLSGATLSSVLNNYGSAYNVSAYFTVANSAGGLISGLTVAGTTLYANSGSITSAVTLSGALSGAGASGTAFTQAIVSAGATVVGGTAIGWADVYDVGGIVSNYSLVSGAGLSISGGQAINVSAAQNSTITAFSGGIVSGGQMSGTGAYLFANSGSTVEGVTVTSQAQIIAGSGSIAGSNTIGSDGHYFQLAGTLDGSAANIFLSGADIKITSDGLGNYGTVQNLSVGNGVGLRIQDGASGSNVTVSAGGTERVFNGGSTSGGTVLSGGNLLVSSAGIASGTTIASAGSATVSGSGTTLANTVLSGGTETVLSGGTASSTTVAGSLVVSSGATVKGTVVTSGGDEYLQSGAVVSGTQVQFGGTQVVSSGAAASATTVSSGGVLAVQSGGRASSVLVSGGSGNVVSGGSAYGGIVESGGYLTLNGGTASGVLVQSGGVLEGWAGSVISGGMVANNASAFLYSGAVASSVHLSGGGIIGNEPDTSAALNIFSGAIAYNTVLDHYGAYTYLDGGIEYNTIVSSGTSDYLLAGSSISANVLSGGQQLVSSGAVASATAVASGGSLVISTGGAASAAIVSGSVSVNGGLASGLTVSGSGATGVVASGGVVSGLTLTSAGKFVAIQSGTVSGGTVSGAGAWLYGSSGGTIAGVTVTSGGQLNVNSGSTIVSNTIGNGGQYFELAGTLDSSTTNIFQSGADIKITSDGLGNYGTVQNFSVGSGVGLRIQDGASGSNVTVSNGGAERVFNGGSTSGGTVLSGGIVSVSGGGTAIDLTVGSSGQLLAISGSVGGNTTVNSGGLLSATAGTVLSGHITDQGTVSGGTLASGAFLDATSGSAGSITVGNGASAFVAVGDLRDTVVLSGGTVSGGLAGSYSGNTTISNGGKLFGGEVHGTLTVSSGGTVNQLWVTSGGKAQLQSGATLSSNITVSAAGSLNLASGAVMSAATVSLENGGQATIWANAGGTIVMNGSTNTGLVVSGLSSGGTLTTTITGFDGAAPKNSDGIEIDGVKASDVTSVSYPTADQVTLTLASGKSITLNITGIEHSGYSLQTATDGDLLFEVCFLAGSMLRTPTGERAVEDMAIGDEICVYDWRNAAELTRSVKWVGHKKMVVRSHLPDDEAGYPVRILKNAVSDGVPYKDLLVTPEHCLFFDGQFIPVRMLVNGRSIFYDRSFTSYTYYHVETDPHSVIWADGTLTESYLDTGNRSTFAQGGTLVLFGDKNVKTWEEDGEAALTVARHQVEPIFRNLEARAEYAGLGLEAPQQKLVDDADLHLVTEAGVVLRRVRENNGHSVFMIPPGVQQVRMVSRTSRPSDTIGPFVDDRRYLGVLVGSIQFFESRDTRKLDQHLKSDQLEGWDVKEAAPCRWTNGNALLSIGAREPGSIGMLAIQVLAAGPYVQNEQKDQVEAIKG
ncbi:Hint domain-containing protein [Gluconobacter cerinus]|uniref:Hedgehog/Intein (Hint) domain-containing protein n=3 Tax=Gluconobacter cerinus TaxID=38307 RepID=A0AAV5NCD0_9PROT|nr:Hint domain-containing protein [Gluconobacter cerinus]GLQ62077.1 hypothetical protein GCM10007867_09220 [Gluconobacter cerinus]